MQWTTGRVSWSSKLPLREVLLQGGVNLFQGSSPPLLGGWINPWNSRMREVVGAMRGGAQRYREGCVNKSFHCVSIAVILSAHCVNCA